MENAELRQVGVVRSDVTEPDEMPPGGVPATVEVCPEYAPALDRLEEHSHAWVLTWFHRSDRDRLHVRPSRVDPNAAEFGVFALRAASRPNPIALSLVEIERIERDGDGARIVVARLDAVGGSPVLDIKPHFENDTIFSPRTPYLRPQTREARRSLLMRHALQHHREDCAGLRQAVRIALIAEERFGHLNVDDLLVSVTGTACLADALQGITRARLSNPARFAYTPGGPLGEVRFFRRGDELLVSARAEVSDWLDENLSDEVLFDVT